MSITLTWVRESAPAHPFEVIPHHGAISVPDVEASIAWYREMLGFAVEARFSVTDIPLKGAFLRRGACRIELFEYAGAAPLPDCRREVEEDLKTHGTKHIAVQVQNVGAALEFLRSKGVQIAMEKTAICGTVASYIRDNSGVLVELVEPFPEK